MTLATIEVYHGGDDEDTPLLCMVAQNPVSPGSLHESLHRQGIKRIRVKKGSPAHEAVKAGDFGFAIDQTPRTPIYWTENDKGELISIDLSEDVVDFDVTP